MTDKVKAAIDYFTEYIETTEQLAGPLEGESCGTEHCRTALAALKHQQQPATNDGVLIVPGHDYYARGRGGRLYNVIVAAVAMDEHCYYAIAHSGNHYAPEDLFSTLEAARKELA